METVRPVRRYLSGTRWLLLIASMIPIRCALVSGQDQGQQPAHVIIPNPTPRPPDLKQEYGDDSKDQKKQDQLSVESQLQAREIWLESNQLLLLTQQLDQAVHSGKAHSSLTANAAKAAQIEKLARSIQDKMKEH